MPINETLLASLRNRYGEDAEKVYNGMVAEARGPFAEGGKYHGEHVVWARHEGVPALSSRQGRGKRR